MITVAGCVVVALFILNLFRVNRPISDNNAATPETRVYTEGVVVSGNANIEPDSFLQYKIDLNRRAKLKGMAPKVEAVAHPGNRSLDRYCSEQPG